MIIEQKFDRKLLDRQDYDFVDFSGLMKSEIPVIVQVGSHDGLLGEEYGLHEYLESLKEFRLFLIEPIKRYFDSLQSVYGKYGDSVTYCPYAITDVDGQVSMLDQGCMSKIDRSGSLAVESKTWESFVHENNILDIDLLLLDCEGFEFEILKHVTSSNISRAFPGVIRYEYMWIQEKAECDRLLNAHGYRIDYCKFDPTYNKIAHSRSS